jgi:multimeric flavodoxin WrbA
MKILGIACSPRKGMTTCQSMEICLEAASAVDSTIETELIDLAGLHIHPCTACNACKKGVLCSIDDDFTPLLAKFADPAIGGIIIGTPVYMGSMTGVCKCLLDRSVVMRRNGFLWGGTVGGVLACGHSRNGGQELTITHVQAAMMIHDMILVSDGAPQAHFGATMWTANGVEADDFGQTTARGLGASVARTALQLNAGSKG